MPPENGTTVEELVTKIQRALENPAMVAREVMQHIAASNQDTLSEACNKVLTFQENSSNGYKLLHLAVRKRAPVEIVRELHVRCRSVAYDEDYHGNLPVHLAVMHKHDESNPDNQIDTVNFLLEQHVDAVRRRPF